MFRPSLLCLPVEVIDQVLLYTKDGPFHTQKDQKTLHAMCLTSKYLYASAKPQLYHEINTGAADLLLLARSLVAKPNLALLIRELNIRSPSQYDLEEAHTLLRTSDLVPAHWTRTLRVGDRPATTLLLLEALLLQAQHLETLSFCSSQDLVHVRLFEGRKSRPMPSLPVLKDLEIYVPSAGGRRDGLLTQVKTILPRQEKLYIELPSRLHFKRAHLDLTLLEDLDISCDYMTRIDVVEIVQACPKLKSFGYHGGNLRDLVFAGLEPVAVKEVFDALRPRERRLKKAAVHYFYDEWAEDELRPKDMLPDLHNFVKLADLDVDFESLLDISRSADSEMEEEPWEETDFLRKLPRSIRQMRIFKADSRLEKEIKDIAQYQPQHLPYLKTLILEYYEELIAHERFTEDVDDNLAEVKEALNKAGIKLLMD